MKERPIIFSSDMVRGIMDDRKTMTRRIVKPEPYFEGNGGWWYPYPDSKRAKHYANDRHFKKGFLIDFPCPYGQPEDRLWVRETYGKSLCGSNIYKADFNPDHPFMPKWKPSIFMSRIASRITLEIISVRVERLQEISQMDIQAEGTPGLHPLGGAYPNQWRERFQSLWNSINKKHPWASNPWVWSIEFKRL